MGQQGHIRPGVADVAKTRREPLLEDCELVVAGQVHAAIGGEHAGKDAHMRSHPLGQQRIRPGSQVNLPPGCVLLPQIPEQRLIVGQVGYVDRRQRRHLALERRLALGHPPGKLQQPARTLPCQHDHRIQQRVRLHQRAVQVHAQRHARDGKLFGHRAPRTWACAFRYSLAGLRLRRFQGSSSYALRHYPLSVLKSRTYLSWRPGHVSSAQQMQMQVVDRLAAVDAGVDHDAVSAIEPCAARQLGRLGNHVSQ